MNDPNPMNRRDKQLAEQLELIWKGIPIDLHDESNTNHQFWVYVEQISKNKDLWELTLSEGNSQYAILYLDSKSIKKLADFLGEMSRISSRVKESQPK